MDYASCLEYLHKHCARNVPGGFKRTKRMAQLVGDPQEQLRTIHIAGTNGKGSTAAIITSILQQAGYQVGLFTSPHLERYEERIRINGDKISKEDFAAVLTYLIEQVIPVLLAEGMRHPGEFELLTVAGWLYFKEKTDFVVSEVGLGGRLDPTNIITESVLTVITPVSLDHCQILGDTVAQIAAEKAGILKTGVPVIVAPQQPEALRAIEQKAESMQVNVFTFVAEQLPVLPTSMQGQYQQINGYTALAAVNNLQQRGIVDVTKEQIAAGLQRAFWPGRMEYVDLGDDRAILLDGAHNPHGISALTKNLRDLYSNRQIILFLSILDDKEQYSMLKEILPLASAVVLTRPAYDQRAQNWRQIEEKMQQIVPDCPCRVYDDYKIGLQQELTALQKGQMLCITGSLYLLGDCRKLLHGEWHLIER